MVAVRDREIEVSNKICGMRWRSRGTPRLVRLTEFDTVGKFQFNSLSHTGYRSGWPVRRKTERIQKSLVREPSANLTNCVKQFPLFPRLQIALHFL
jgi:hypothetical protein